MNFKEIGWDSVDWIHVGPVVGSREHSRPNQPQGLIKRREICSETKRMLPSQRLLRTTRGPTQYPIRCVPEVLSGGVTLTTHPHLVPRS
jgi:hypothetical protein